MTTRIIKSRRAAGVTLIECIAVVGVIGALVAMLGVAMVQNLRTYSADFVAESVEGEVQRGAMEVDYFVSKSVSLGFSGSTNGSFLTGALSGDCLRTIDENGTMLVFYFKEDPSLSTADYREGTFGVVASGDDYVYSKHARFYHSWGLPAPFSLTSVGGVVYRFEVSTPVAPVMVQGIPFQRGSM